VIFTHGRHSLDPLFSDSITTRFDRRPLRMLSHAAVVFIVMLVTIIPVAWPVSKLGRGWRKVMPNTAAERSSWGFMALWTVVTGLATAVTFPMYLRYLLPAIPMLSAMSAIALVRMDPAVLAHCFRRCLQIGLMLAVVLVAVVAVLCVQMRFGPGQIAILFTLVSAIVAAGVIGFRGSWLQSAQSFAVISVLALTLVSLVLNAAARIDLQESITQHMRQEHLDSQAVVGFVGQRGCATRLRLALGPRVNLVQWPDWPAEAGRGIIARLDLPAVLVLPLRAADLLPDGYDIQSVGSIFDSSDDGDFLPAFRDGKIGECIEEHRIPYCIAVRQGPRMAAD
jgi:hypothetical protein